jgi:hypothetical protein
MKLSKYLILGLGLGLATGASAGWFSDQPGMKQKCMEDHSFAWCMLDAASLSKGVGDYPKESFYKNMGSTKLESAVDVGMFTGAVTGMLNTPGISKGFNASTILLGMLMNSSPRIVGENLVVAWMPAEMAPNGYEARKLLRRMIFEATKESFPNATLELLTFGGEYSLTSTYYTGYALDHDSCGSSKCYLARVRNHIDGKNGLNNLSSAAGDVYAPEWLGGGKAWIIQDYMLELAVENAKANTELVTSRYAQVFSKHLPKWVFVSTSPEANMKGTNVKINRGQGLPIIYNEGKAYLPIFPEIKVAENEKIASADK